MRKALLTFTLLFAAIALSFGQVTYSVSGPINGGTTDLPLVTGSSSSITSWTEFHAYNAGGTGNTWSETVEIGFPFEFYGTPVTHFICSKNMLLSFDTSLTGMAVDTSINDNTSLPNANLPNNTIAYFWDNFADGTTSLGTNDDIFYTVVGTMPNRQLWIKPYSYESGGQSFTYIHLILEEGSNNIYFYDSRNGTLGAGSRTIGVQLDASTAVQTAGSPNEVALTGNTTNFGATTPYWLFQTEQLVPNNAGVAAITSPMHPLSVGMQNVMASVVNSGTATLNSYSLTATVDDGSSVTTLGPTAFADTIMPGDTSSAKAIGMFNFMPGIYTIKAWTSMPNGQADTVNNNDTMMVTLCTPLTGAYTIDQGAPASGTNFTSFNALAATLAQCGMSGPVTVDVVASSGPYNEQVVFNAVAGASAANTITINGNGETISFPGMSPNYAVMAFDGAKHFTIDNLVVAGGAGSTTTMGIIFTNAADSNTVQNSTIDMTEQLGTTSTSSNGIVATSSLTSATGTGTNADYLTIHNNTIIGGYYGIRLNQSSSSDAVGNVVTDNIVQDFYSYGIYGNYQDGMQVTGNEVMRANRTSVTTFYGIYYTNCHSSMTSKNSIHNTHDNASSLTGAAYAIYHTSSDATMGNEHKVINNLVYNFNGNGTVSALYNSGSDYVQYWHNTISLDYDGSTAGTTRGLYQTTTATGIDIQNNVFSITRGGSGTKTGIYLNSTGSTVSSNYNNIYLGGAGSGALHVGYYSGTQTTSGDWQAANGGIYDANSVFSDPLLADPAGGDLTPLAAGPNETGTNVGVTTDFFMASRDTVPDMGAIEFSPASSNLAMLAFTGLADTTCYGDSMMFGFSVTNLIGSADFSSDNMTIMWSVDGPNATSGSIVVNSGSLNGGDTATYMVSGVVDLSNVGENTFNAWLVYGPDSFPTNDTLNPVTLGVKQMTVTATDDLLYDGQSAELTANHPFLTAPVAFTEVWQFTTAYSSSVSLPAYYTGGTNRDLIELTNFGSTTADLSGWTFERQGSSDLTYTFPSGATIASGGSLILATGTGTDDPANGLFYIGGSADAVFSSTSVGYILRDAGAGVVDVVATNGYSPTGIAPSDWSGSIPSASSQMGVYLNGVDDNTATNWVVTTSGYQNTLTIGTPNGSSNASDPVVNWFVGGSPLVDSAVVLVNGPLTTGTYTYTASFTAQGCVFTDSATVMVGDSCPLVDSVWVWALSDSSVVLRWDTVPGVTSYKITLVGLGGNSTITTFKYLQIGQKTINGLVPGTKYAVQIRAQCGAGFGNPSEVIRFVTFSGECALVMGATVDKIKADAARISYTVPVNVQRVWIRWREVGSMVWSGPTRRDASKTAYWINNLTPATTYEWQIKSVCTAGGLGSEWSNVATFTTLTNKWEGVVDTETTSNAVSVFPNPNNGQFQLQISSEESGVRDLLVTDALGAVVLSNRIAVATGDNNLTVDLKDVPAGIYFVRVANEENVMIERLVIE